MVDAAVAERAGGWSWVMHKTAGTLKDGEHDGEADVRRRTGPGTALAKEADAGRVSSSASVQRPIRRDFLLILLRALVARPTPNRQ